MSSKLKGRHGVRGSFRVIATLMLALYMPACALLKAPEKPRDTFELTAPRNLGGVSGRTTAQILVKTPTSLKSIDSDRMILRPSPSSITYVAGAQWADTVPRMVQAKLVEVFENTGATGATARPGDGLVIDYQLVSDIRRFEIDARNATIEISIKLLTDRSGLVRETRIFTATSQVRSNDAEDYVAAFDAAFGQMSREIVNWVLRAI